MMDKYERRYDLDWLRIFAVVTVFFFYSARFFDYDAWHVKNSELSSSATLFLAFTVQWLMPLFFVISGQSAFFSLRVRGGRQFILERFRRLIIPFLFGVFVLSPPQIYFERVSQGQFAGSFSIFYPHYFEGLYGFGGNFALMGLHLWYLLFLFVFSLLTLPLFLYLKRESSRGISVLKMAAFLKKPGAIFLLAVPLVLVVALADLFFQSVGLLGEGIGFVYFGGWNPIVYLVFFVYGYLLASNEFLQTIRTHGRVALVMGLILSILIFLPVTSNYSFLDYLSEYPFVYILSAFYSWFWVVAILSLGSLYLSFGIRWLKDANEAVLPFYVLSQPVILTVGFYIVSLRLGVFTKYSLIATTSMILIIFLVLVIKRANLLRFLFGMRLSKERNV